MSRILRIAGAQMGPNQRADSRAAILGRMIALLEQAAAEGAKLVVFPELAFTTFFPRWPMDRDSPELLACFETAMPNPQVQPLFDRARELGVGFYVGYAELTPAGERFNSAVTVGPDGQVLFKYRKIHLPGSDQVKAGQRYQQLEKMYFRYGDMGFPAARGPAAWGAPVLGMLICNDRRWPEGWRVLGLDLSLPMLQAARNRIHAELAPEYRLQLALAPMDRLPVANGCCALVIAHGVWNLARSSAEFRQAVSTS